MSRESERHIRIGVSACLVGQAVRYDGRDKRHAVLVEDLGQEFELVPVCPEVAIGLGVPRPPIRLEGEPRAPRAVGVDNPALDVTDALLEYGRRMAQELGGIDGYVLKSKSPSCGLLSTRLFDRKGREIARGAGLYARALREALPGLPMVEEDSLDEPVQRRAFIAQVLEYHRCRTERTRLE